MLLVVGLGFIATGAFLVAGPLWSAWHREHADQSAVNGWKAAPPLTNAIAGAVSSTPAVPAGLCGSSNTGDYALLDFVDPAQYHYAGIAGNGTWDMLTQRTMVHYDTTPAPGQQGNVIFAFHREPDYQYIDQLGVGGTVTIQDRSCRTYTYRVTQKWVLAPSQVTQLNPTTGHELTLITCTPWWQDYDRIVWRAELVG